MIRKIFLYLLLLAFTPIISFSQETVTGLQSNSQIEKINSLPSARKTYQADTVNLPFFDDFSTNSILPRSDRWADDYVFINNTYSDKQITKGVATFDALSNTGRLYENASSAGFRADNLTSQPLNLDYPASANIKMSFLYEAGGLSDAPEPEDSLTLQFFAPGENEWYSVWRVAGYSSNKGFRTAIISINQPRFLKKGFRFRFTNYASISRNLSDPSMIGNCDIWNLDYVYLNSNRSSADTTYRDIAFRLPVRSLLKNHEAMPWKQFRQVSLQEMGSFIPIQYRNNDAIVRNVTRNFEIRDMGKNLITHSFTAGAANIEPGSNVTYNANLIYTFSSDNPDSAVFRITCSLKTDEFDPKQNDTIVYYQVFRNYFAFDDGTSEGGYGINGLGSRNAMLAYRFTSYMQDTLRAVRICFNHSYMESNKRAFDLMVWDDNNGVPGNVIYSKEEVMVENGDPINGFYTYYIPGGVKIEGDFYVGWKQRSETFLNAGLDINTPHKGRQLYWLNGEWTTSQVNGSVMIRPVTGMPLLTGISYPEAQKGDEVSIWPNPASDRITLSMKEPPYSSSAYVSFVDMSGHELMKVHYREDIDVSALKKGMYIVITTVNGKQVGHNRLIIK